MAVTHVHADVEQLFIGWAPTVLSCRPLTETPADLAAELTVQPVVRITRIGGPSGLPGFDNPMVDWDCFGLTRPAAKAFAYQLAAAVEFQLPGYFNPYGVVSTALIISGPSWRPWDNTGLRRFGFTSRHAIHSRT